nr:replication protein A 70 kDa DNA-binding subunit B-like [Ipomoea batatas]
MRRYMIKFKHDALVKEYKRVNFPKTMFHFKSFEAILSKQEIDEKVLIGMSLILFPFMMEKFASATLLMLLNCFSTEFHDPKKSYNSNLTPLRCIDSASRLSGANLSSWHEGVVRYKVIVRGADESGDAPMLIWDQECEELVGLSAGDLKAKYPKGNKSYSTRVSIFMWHVNVFPYPYEEGSSGK